MEEIDDIGLGDGDWRLGTRDWYKSLPVPTYRRGRRVSFLLSLSKQSTSI